MKADVVCPYLPRLSGTLTSMLAKLWALLSRSWSRADLSQAFCHRRHLYSHNRRYSSNPCYFSLCPPASLHLLTNTAPPPGLSSRSSPPPQLPRQQCTNGTQICGSSNRSTSWSRNRPEECHRGIFLTSLTRVSRARWVPLLKSVQKGRLTARISKCKARNLRPCVCPSTISHVTGIWLRTQGRWVSNLDMWNIQY